MGTRPGIGTQLAMKPIQLRAAQFAVDRPGPSVNANINVLIQGCKSGFDLAQPRSMVEAKQSVDLFAVPAQAAGKLGAIDTSLTHGEVELRLESGEQRELD